MHRLAHGEKPASPAQATTVCTVSAARHPIHHASAAPAESVAKLRGGVARAARMSDTAMTPRPPP